MATRGVPKPTIPLDSGANAGEATMIAKLDAAPQGRGVGFGSGLNAEGISANASDNKRLDQDSAGPGIDPVAAYRAKVVAYLHSEASEFLLLKLSSKSSELANHYRGMSEVCNELASDVERGEPERHARGGDL